MSLKLFTRTAAATTVVLVAAASWLTFLAPGADALAKDRIVIRENDVVEFSFDPIVANNPAGEATDPATCATSPYCDVIPLTVEVPDDLDPDAEYFLQFLLSWDSVKLPGDPVLEPDGIAVNDVDIYLYTDPATYEEAEARGAQPDTEADPWIANGATQADPEQAFLFKPSGDYLITVINWLGANTGYTIKITWVSESFDSPFESLAPVFTPPTAAPTTTSSTTTTTVFVPDTSPEIEVTDLTLPPLETDIESEFDTDEFAFDDFEEEISAPPTVPVVTARPPDPPSGLALLLWLLALPAALSAAGGSVLMRRSRRMISA